VLAASTVRSAALSNAAPVRAAPPGVASTSDSDLPAHPTNDTLTNAAQPNINIHSLFIPIAPFFAI
ncbi:MAG: hypothetical protein ACNA7J_12530, partial [Wenzhouxiangella sp.]